MSLAGPVAVLASFMASIAVTWIAREVAARRRFLDQPNARSAHTRPTPRVGGVGIMVPFLLTGVIVVFVGGAPAAFFVALGATAAIAAVGIVDDIRPLPVSMRIVLQVFAAVGVLWARGPDFAAGFGALGAMVPPWLLAIVAVLWIVWCTNLYNFMDGIDGLAGGQTVLAMLGIAVAALLLGSTTTAWLAASLAAAALGFLVFNFPPATIFMGDVGSTSIGFFVASVPFLPEQAPVTVEIVVLAVALFGLDATVTLVRRIAKGERFFQAHRTHYYQRPLACGVPHRSITVTAYSAMTPLALAAAIYPLVSSVIRAGFGILAIVTFLSLTVLVRRLECAAPGDTRLGASR